MSAGFSLVFGSIFAKTYRVHKLFNNCRTSFVKTRFLKDTHLIALISTPVVVDAIILTLWVVIDPLDRKLHNLTLDFMEGSSVVYKNQVRLMCLMSSLNKNRPDGTNFSKLEEHREKPIVRRHANRDIQNKNYKSKYSLQIATCSSFTVNQTVERKMFSEKP